MFSPNGTNTDTNQFPGTMDSLPDRGVENPPAREKRDQNASEVPADTDTSTPSSVPPRNPSARH